MDDDKELISFDDAVTRLPPGDNIHTFRQAGPMLLGADHGRTSLLATELESLLPVWRSFSEEI